MQKPQAFLNGRFVPAAELVITVYDAGFILGATVSEQLRTFRGKLFKLEEHLARLKRGLKITGITLDCSLEQLGGWAEELAAANHKLLDPADDLGLSLFVTPGPYGTFAPPDVPRTPTIGMSTYALPFQMWAAKYETGEYLAVSTVRQVPEASWPREMKCRSRMHYFLADREVRERMPGVRALLLDERGYVNETSTANIMAFVDTGTNGNIWTPPRDATLQGISQKAVWELAYRRFGVGGNMGSQLRADELAEDWREVWLTSTPFCLLPVVKIDDAEVGDGRPGPMFKKLLAAWSEEVGVDIAAQATRFATR